MSFLTYEDEQEEEMCMSKTNKFGCAIAKYENEY